MRHVLRKRLDSGRRRSAVALGGVPLLLTLAALLFGGGTAAAAACSGGTDLCTDSSGFISYPIARQPSDQSDCGWTLSVDFGDGTRASYGFNGTPFTISHTYPHPGVYSVHGSATNGHSPSGKWTCPSYSLVVSIEFPLGEPCGPQKGAVILGTPAGDRLSGTSGGDLLDGGSDDDVLDGGAGDDCLNGGDDLDWLKGGPGNDQLDGGAEADLLDGKEGDDALEGGTGEDFVTGGGGRDKLAGGDDDDILSDGLGANAYFGGPGDDVISARQSIAERVNCGPGSDIAYVDVKDKTAGCEDVRREGPPSLAWPDNLDRGEGPGRTGPAPLESRRTLQSVNSDFARRWAPLVFLHSEERFLPEVANDYIGMAALRFAHPKCPDHEVKRRGTVDPFKLSSKTWHPGSGWTKTPYYHQRSNPLCLFHRGRSYSTAEHTRPHDNGVFGKPPRFEGEGFFLDIPNAPSARAGQDPARVPVYYECCYRIGGGGLAITYWFFYAYDYKQVANGMASQRHEADWERISIRFDASLEPQTVAFYAHDASKRFKPDDPTNGTTAGNCALGLGGAGGRISALLDKFPGYRECTWASIERVGDHPVVYSAQGSHASYPAAGNWELTGLGSWFAFDYTGNGTPWRTWKHLSDAWGQAWWGYGGGWGANSLLSFNSGPLGPSFWKYPYPEAWDYR